MKKLFSFLYLANLCGILFFWWFSYGANGLHTFAGFLIALGDLAGLITAYSLLWQVLLMSRLVPLERAFGRLKLAELHHDNGYIALTALLIHPTLITFGYSLSTHKGIIKQFLNFLTSFEDVFKAFLAFLLVLTLITLSITIARQKLKYESWYFVHLSSYLAIILAFGHQTKNGLSFLGHPLFITYWNLLYVVVAVIVLYYRFGLPLYRLFYHRFQVEKVEKEASNILSIYITGRHLEAFPFQAGQFAIWRFLTPTLWWQAHPFSLSSEYNGTTLRLTVKGLGDYTQMLPSLKPGDFVLIDGPHGIFTPTLTHNDKLLLVAGGIGITPLRAMLTTFAKEGKDTILLYSCRTKADFAFRKEIDNLSHTFPNLKVTYLSDGKIIDTNSLPALVKDLSKRDIYLCGPVPMMNALSTLFEEQGVAKEHIYTERFAY